MKHKLILLAFIVVSVGFAGCAAEQYSQSGKGRSMKVDTLRMMKVDDIIALTKAGVSDSLIIQHDGRNGFMVPSESTGCYRSQKCRCERKSDRSHDAATAFRVQ